ETDEDFEQTYTAIERIRYSNIFLFKYSPRPGTPAAKLSSGLVNRKIAQARFERIMSLQQEITREIYQSWMGREITVLVEGTSKKDVSKYTGRTVQNIVVNFMSDKDYTGEIIRVKVKKCGQYSLAGSAI
ncbi:tRNA-i(6)A37 methylthiotransferase, partial [hydrothermal vent metagenome]